MTKQMRYFFSRIPKYLGSFLVALMFAAFPSSMVPQVNLAHPPAAYELKLDAARDDYFRGLAGDREAENLARQKFADLEHDHPQESLVIVYAGSLDLLESARTWAIWNKHTLAAAGLEKMDQAVNHAPDNLEVRFIRAATTWHLPFFFHRREQAEKDFAFISPRAEEAARKGILSPALAAAALSYYGQVLSESGNHNAARQAFEAAVRVDGTSPAGQDAMKHLRQ